APRFPEGIFEIDFAGYRMPIITSAALAAEVLDERRFRKTIGAPLSSLRPLAGDGLFTAEGDEPNWELAHRILVPAFSQRARRQYLAPMLAVAGELLAHWRARAGQWLDVSEQMTRLTLDTIALAGFDYRFDSFARREPHPFVAAMVRVLAEAMRRAAQPRFARYWRWAARRRFQRDVAFLHGIVDEVIRTRRQKPAPVRDLLALMLEGRDPKTGAQLADENIRYQVITFLIAGHETTSGLLSFALYFLTRKPAVLARAREEALSVLAGRAAPEYEDLDRLLYIEQVLEESLRLWPTAPAFHVAPYRDEIIGGRWRIAADQRVTVLLPALHRDPAVWEAPDRFDPERFAPARRARIPRHAYRPFGNGARACIGQQFAMMEAKLALALLLTHFELEAEPGYRLRVAETLTLKPEGFRIRVRPLR
ncbi:MAG: cytochrome P450, partial [Burkholderiaceae bacterium]|nr:cytochrome P450 [Burkholderiaceae bacterium]